MTKPHMNIGKIDRQMLAISKFLVESVILREVITPINLMQRVMKGYFLVTPPRVKPISVITTNHRR